MRCASNTGVPNNWCRQLVTDGYRPDSLVYLMNHMFSCSMAFKDSDNCRSPLGVMSPIPCLCLLCEAFKSTCHLSPVAPLFGTSPSPRGVAKAMEYLKGNAPHAGHPVVCSARRERRKNRPKEGRCGRHSVLKNALSVRYTEYRIPHKNN